MKRSTYYIGYFLGQPLCASIKPKYIRRYMIDNRKLSEDAFDILPAYGDLLVSAYNSQEDIFLCEYKGKYVTNKELRLIIRDWGNFIDRCCDTKENLLELLKYTNGNKDAIFSIIEICENIIENTGTSTLEFEKFFNAHHLVNMSMATYAAFVKDNPAYYEDQFHWPYFLGLGCDK